MRKKQLTIKEYKNIYGVHTIIVNNARCQKDFCGIIEKIIEEFLTDREVFFGLCRTDGINLSSEQQRNLKNEIPAFFQKNGEMQNLSEYLTVAKIESNNYDRNFILAIFDYYLETLMFNPKVDWHIFKQYYSDYQEHRFEDFILNHYADILLYYFDSGDFLICFDSQKYNSSEIRSRFERLFGV